MEYFSKILHIDIEENAQSIIQRFSSLEDHDIIFAIPTGALIFDNPSELKLLKQAIDKSEKNIVLVSQDESGLDLARDLGFIVEEEFLELLSPDENSHKYSAGTHKHPRVSDIIHSRPETKTMAPSARKITIAESPSIKTEIESEDMEETADQEESVQKHRKGIFSFANIIIIFIAVSIIVASVSLVVILPEANIVILPKKETIILDLPIKADTSLSEIDFTNNKIPGQIIKVEKEKTLEFQASGKTESEKKATGTITVYNEYNPPQNQALIKTTRFITADGKIFRTVENIIIPAAKIENGKIVPGKIDVSVIADTTGSEYNIGPSEFSIPGFAGTPKFNVFYGKSTSSMQGGSKGESPMITLEDINNAKKNIGNELLESAKNELKEKLPKDLEFIEEAVKAQIIEEKISAQAGTATATFSIYLKVSALAFLFQENDVKSLITKNIENKITIDKITYKNMRKSYIVSDTDFPGGIMSFNARIEQDIAASFDTEILKKSFAGKNEAEIREYVLSQDLMEGANISFWPKFVKRAPTNTNKINITVGD